jgi:hypothetical protein
MAHAQAAANLPPPNVRAVLAAALLVWLPASAVRAVGPAGTNFTYQGDLRDGGLPVTDTVDFEFRLWNEAGGGAQVGSTDTVLAVVVTDGLFTVDLDFGGLPFDGTALWLEASVRYTSVGGSYTALAPRQPLTATPYAIRALIDEVGGLVLPYAGSVAAGVPAFSVTNSGGAQAGEFLKTAGGAPAALKAASEGISSAIWALNTGGAAIGAIPEVIEDAAVSAWNLGSGDAVKALNGGLGRAIFAQVENTTSFSEVIRATTTGLGNVIVADIPDPSSAGSVVLAGTAGVGNAVEADQFGLSGSAVYATNYIPASPSPAVDSATFGSGPAGQFVNLGAGPIGTEDGVVGVSLSSTPNRIAAGVHAVGFGAAGPGLPNAAALNIDNGAVNVSGPNITRAAGTLIVPLSAWIRINSCSATCPPNCTHVHPIGYYADVTLANDLIITGGTPDLDDSIILATVETLAPGPLGVPPFPTPYGAPQPWVSWYVQVHSKAPGTCTFRITRMGQAPFDPLAPDPDCPEPVETNVINYVIINPT